MSSITVPDECNPKATFLLLNPWGPFRSYVNQRVPLRSYVIARGTECDAPIIKTSCDRGTL